MRQATPSSSALSKAFSSLRLLVLPSVLALTIAASGCVAKAAPVVTAKDRAFAEFKVAQAKESLAKEPPLADAARDAALDALAVDPQSVGARLALVDALFARGEYKESLKELKPLEKRGVSGEEVLYRKARGLYWFHSYGVRGNYAKARETAKSCLLVGSKYLVECHTIIRNSYLGEARGDAAKTSEAYVQAAQSATTLLGALRPEDPAYGDTALVLAEYYLIHLDRASEGERYLADARAAAAGRPRLGERIAAFERERQLRTALAAAP